ncbi:MAG: hypothetical protein R3F59_15950 [Myxococcota bacterium]
MIASIRQFTEPSLTPGVFVARPTPDAGRLEVVQRLEGWCRSATSFGSRSPPGARHAACPGGLHAGSAATLPVAHFRTALAPGTRRVVRFGATSCPEPWCALALALPGGGLTADFFLLPGDTIYADEGLSCPGQYPEHWTRALATEGLR